MTWSRDSPLAAVALPVGVAYAQLAGFNPAVGLSSILLQPKESLRELSRRGATLTVSGRQTEWRMSRPLPEGFPRSKIFATLRAAVKAHLGREGDLAGTVPDADSA